MVQIKNNPGAYLSRAKLITSRGTASAPTDKQAEKVAKQFHGVIASSDYVSLRDLRRLKRK